VTYIWEVLLNADEQDFPREGIRFVQTKTLSPYMEVTYGDLNRKNIGDEAVEINAYYRFAAIFDHLLNGLDEHPEFRERLYDILMHYLALINIREGLCKNEYYGLFLREDVQTGKYGQEFRKVFSTFARKQVRFVVESMVRLYSLGASVTLFRTVMRQLYPRSLIYLDVVDRRELLVYIGEKETPELRRQVDFLLALFVPFDYIIHLFWDMHFGIFGVNETLELDDFVIYRERCGVMAVYTMGEVKIDGNYPVNEVLELSMDVGANRHGRLIYGGLVSEEDAQRYIRQSADGEVVSVFLRDEIEFCGCPHEVLVEHQNSHWYLRVTLVTTSKLMDVYPCNRFFQDTSYSFKDMLTEAYEDSGAGSVVAIRGQEEIWRPILQYRETDWNFTLRMAGRLGTVIFPNVASGEPQVFLGVPNRPAITETNDIVYSVGRYPDEYRRKFAMNEWIEFQNFLCYRMRSDNRYKLGDSVSIDEKVLTVMQKTFKYERGEIVEHYVLGHEEEFAVPLHHNTQIAGLELEGKVLMRADQKLAILLDIDAERSECGKTWFCYAPTSNNGMYSMPLVDEKVMLSWQSEVDCNALVVRPYRKNGRAMPHHGERHFLEENENHLMMVPNKVEYTNLVGSMKWLASVGFDISTCNNFDICAENDILIKSKKQVQVFSPERISVCKVETKEIEEEFQITTIYTPISSIDMLGNEMHIKARDVVNEKSAMKNYEKTVLPERPEFTIETSVAEKLAGAIATK